MAIQLPIYMDNHATTPVDPRVIEAMLPYFNAKFGNAASRSHVFGWTAEESVSYAREQIAKLIGAESEKEIVITSGATESDNLALKGIADFYKDKGDHIITSVVEHKAVLDSCKRLEKEGYRVTYLGVGTDGRVNPDDVKRAITDKTILISIMLAHNEVGTVNPIGEIGKIARERGIIFHTDAVQGIGKVPFDVQKMNVDLASITAHKMYGPKGVGALYIRRSRPRVRWSHRWMGASRARHAPGTSTCRIVGFARRTSALKDGPPKICASWARDMRAPCRRSRRYSPMGRSSTVARQSESSPASWR
jgi:cysteine desulfurase